MLLPSTALPSCFLLLQSNIVKAHLCDESDESQGISHCNGSENPSPFPSAEIGIAKRDDRKWEIQDDYSGDCFFDGFDFFDAADPTHGMNNYVNREKAFADGLAFWTADGIPGIQAEHFRHTKVGEYRDSVRIQSKELYNGGLFIVDFKQMPWGCGVWPAFWTLGYGKDWPLLGEIDILASTQSRLGSAIRVLIWPALSKQEGIHARTENQYTIHTTAGCLLDNAPGLFTGKVRGTNCDVGAGAAGCAVISGSNASYGEPFNAAGGGAFAMLWDDEGLHFWDWTRNNIPADLDAGTPDVASWGTPSGLLSASQCDPWKYFIDHQLILNIDLCGDWPRGSWPSYCPGTCAETIADPANLQNTVFLINYIRVYQPVDATPTQETVATKRSEKHLDDSSSGSKVDDSHRTNGTVTHRPNAATKIGSANLNACLVLVGVVVQVALVI